MLPDKRMRNVYYDDVIRSAKFEFCLYFFTLGLGPNHQYFRLYGNSEQSILVPCFLQASSMLPISELKSFLGDKRNNIQWNPSITDTIGTQNFVHYSGCP